MDAEYNELLNSSQLETKTYKCISDDWEAKKAECYNALISIEYLPMILAIPDMKIYAWCRCKLVANNKSAWPSALS